MIVRHLKSVYSRLLLVSITFVNGAFSQSDTTLLQRHVHFLCDSDTSRSYQHVERLQDVAAYIFNTFSEYADTVYFQPYLFRDAVFVNVVAVFNPQRSSRIVIGAHYDVCEDKPGADDNASGLAGLLETARLLKRHTLNERIELVAYTLEEPPFFRTELMGSYVHAQSLAQDSIETTGMICLEMIGYYSNEKNSQHYPIGLLKLFYGSRGNYITLVNKNHGGKFAKRFSNNYRHTAKLPAKKFTGSPKLTGIDFSDHLNYWALGIPAVMLTDTSFYRNRNYHQDTDTIDTLDFGKMALVVDALVNTLVNTTSHP